MQTIQCNVLANVCGGMGRGGGVNRTPTVPARQTTQPAQQQQQQQPASTAVGDMCREGYAAVGAGVGGVLTSETGGWGALPGAMIGAGIGHFVCPP